MADKFALLSNRKVKLGAGIVICSFGGIPRISLSKVSFLGVSDRCLELKINFFALYCCLYNRQVCKGKC